MFVLTTEDLMVAIIDLIISFNVENVNMPVATTNVFFPQFVYLEGLVTSVSDMYPSFFFTGHRRKLLLLVICVVLFFIGLFMVTEVRVHCLTCEIKTTVMKYCICL